MAGEGYDGLPNYYSQSSDPLTPNLGLSLKGMDPIVAENFVILDSHATGGSSVKINGSSVTNPNFNNTTPVAPSGKSNITWQVDGSGNVSAYVIPSVTNVEGLSDVLLNSPILDGAVFCIDFFNSTVIPNVTHIQEDVSSNVSVTVDSVAGIALGDLVQFQSLNHATYLNNQAMQVASIVGLVITGVDPTGHGFLAPTACTGQLALGQWGNSQFLTASQGAPVTSMSGMTVSNSASMVYPFIVNLGSYSANATTTFPSGGAQLYTVFNPTQSSGATIANLLSASDWTNPNNYTGQIAIINYLGPLGGISFGQSGTVPQDLYSARIVNPANTLAPTWQASRNNIALWADDTYVSSLSIVKGTVNFNGAGGNVNFGDPTVLALWESNSGSPEGVVTAPVGSLFSRTDGTSSTAVYFKGTGSGNTGWVAINIGGGTVTSVAMTGDGTIFNSSVSGSPITTSGTLAPSLVSQTANTVLAGPTSGPIAAPTFRTLVANDIPSLPYIPTTVMTTLGDTIYGGASGAATRLAGNTTTTKMYLSQTGAAGPVSAAPVWAQIAIGDLANVAGGTVLGNNTTSSAAPSATISPVLGIPGTSTGTIALASSTASGKYTITAPANAATPTLTLPTTSNVLAGQLAGDGTVFSSSLVTASAAGTLTLPTPQNQTANTHFAGPASGAAAAPTFRALVPADLPTVSVGAAGFWGGTVYPNFNTDSTTVVLSTNNEVRAIQFVLPFSITVDHVTFFIGVGQTSAKCDFGFYNAAGTTLLATTGGANATTAQNGVNRIAFTGSVTLQAGVVYWFAFTCNNAAVTFQNILIGANQATVLNQGSVRMGTSGTASSGGALGASLGTLSAIEARTPLAFFE